MKFGLLLISLCFILNLHLILGYIKVDTNTQLFIDEFGRTRIFHGLNAVYKIAPWLPSNKGFDPSNSLCEEDAINLRDWGFNSIRLGVMWPGLEPVRGQYNTTYLQAVKDIVDMLSKYGIYTILDFHQDLFNRKFCGEGAPDWASIPSPYTLPFALPAAPELKIDPTTGYPSIEDCLQRNFGTYYFSHKVGNVFQNLYDNVDGIQDSLAGYWSVVSKYFNNTDSVLGYELINEPFAGDFIRHPSVLLPEYTDYHNLQPMYKKLNNAIRKYDDHHLIFFEKSIIDAVGRNGFTEGPGGPAYNDRQVYSYHIYCAPTDREGDPTNIYECDLADEGTYDFNMGDLKRLGCGGFMTEFGAVPEANNSIAMLRFLVSAADNRLQSWAYWQFKYYNDITTAGSGEALYDKNGNLETTKLKELSRTYAHAIQGVPTGMYFSPETSAFTLEFHGDPSIAAPTVIYLNQKLYYPSGFSVQISPPNVATWKQMRPNYIQINLSSSSSKGQLVKVLITQQ